MALKTLVLILTAVATFSRAQLPGNGTPSPSGNTCPITPTHHPRANLIVNCDGFTVGSRCSLSCPPGTILRSDIRIIQCQESGRWSHSLYSSSCIARCKDLSRSFRNASLIVTCTGRSVGSTCRIYCDKGRMLKGGVSSITCLISGEWSSSLAESKCVYNEKCPVRHGPVLSPQPDRCRRCPTTCSNGKICCPTQCGDECITPAKCQADPPTPPNSNLILNCTGYHIGDSCTVGCSPSQELLGGITNITCVSPGIWDQSLIRSACVCPTPRFLHENAGVKFSCSGNTVGSHCNISCVFHGLKLQGIKTRRIRCEASGSWSSNVEGAHCLYDARCQQRTPSKPPAGAKCQHCPEKCFGGEICCPSGCNATCIAIVCPAKPTLPPNSRIRLQCSNANRLGSTCNITCPPGLNLVGGISSIRCQSTGRWSRSLIRSACVYNANCPRIKSPNRSQQLPQCRNKMCPRNGCRRGRTCCPSTCGDSCVQICLRPIPQPPNSRLKLKCTNQNYLGSKCKVSCPSGLILEGGVSSTTCAKFGSTLFWYKSLTSSACVYDKRCPKTLSVMPLSVRCECPPICPSGQACCEHRCGFTCRKI